jgi:hypothetical protein
MGVLPGVLLAVHPAFGGDYRYEVNRYEPLPPAPVASLAVYPLDYPFPDEGLVSFAKAQANLKSNVEKLYRRSATDRRGRSHDVPPFMHPRDLLSYCLYLDIKDMPGESDDRPWISRVDFGPDPTKIGFYDLKITGRMDVIIMDQGKTQQLDIVLILSAPRDLGYVRRLRTRFSTPTYWPGREGAMLPAFRAVNQELCLWLRREIGALDAQAMQASRLDEATAFITTQWDENLPRFSRRLRAALQGGAPPTVISTWAQAYDDRWYESGILYDDVVLLVPSLESAGADVFCDHILRAWADKYQERDRTFAAAGAGQAPSIILAIAAASGGTIADADLGTSAHTPASSAAAGAIALPAGLRAEFHHQLAKLNVAPGFDERDIVARIENVDGLRYQGFKERLKSRPDRAVEIAAEFYGANRQTLEEVAASAADRQGQFVGAMNPE